MQSLFNVSEIRNDFPLLHLRINGQPLVYLDNAATTQKPSVVIRAIEEYYTTMNANVHRGNYYLSQKATEAYEKSRKTARKFINASSEEEVIFTRGTTESVNLVACSFTRSFLEPGDEILISAMEHHSNIVPWQLACEQSGACLKVIPVNQSGELDLTTFEKQLNPKVRIVSVTHISNVLGTINPVEKIIMLSHQKNIPVMLDGAQAAPHLPIDLNKLGCDFYCFSGHKIYGPTGIGILYGKKEWLDKMLPYQGGGEMIEKVTFERTSYNNLPYKFEAGTPDICGAIALEKSLKYISELGINQIAKWENQLLNCATEKLNQIEGLTIYGQAANKASVISFNIEGIHPSDLGVLLDKMGVSVRTGSHCAQPLMDFYGIPGTVRASFAFYNTEEEIDILVKSIKQAARMLKG